jgi:hypothetical protein
VKLGLSPWGRPQIEDIGEEVAAEEGSRRMLDKFAY